MSTKLTTNNTNRGGPVSNAEVRHIIHGEVSGSYTFARAVYLAKDKNDNYLYVFYFYPTISTSNFSNSNLMKDLTIKIFRVDSPYQKAPVSTTTALPFEILADDGNTIKLLEPCYYGDTYRVSIHIPKNLGIYIDKPNSSGTNDNWSGDLTFESWDAGTRTLTLSFKIKGFAVAWEPDEWDDKQNNDFSFSTNLLDFEYEMIQKCQTGVETYANTFLINGDPYGNYKYLNIGDEITVLIEAAQGFTFPSTPQYLFGDSSNPNYLLKEGTTIYTFEGVSYLNPIYYEDVRGNNKLKAEVLFNVNTYKLSVDPIFDTPDICEYEISLGSSVSYGNDYGKNFKDGDTLYYDDKLYITMYLYDGYDFFHWDSVTITHGNESITFSEADGTLNTSSNPCINYSLYNTGNGTNDGVKGDVTITGVRKPDSTTIQEIKETDNFGAKIVVNRVSSPNQGAETGALSQGSTIYAGDVLEIYYTIPTSVQPYVDSGEVSFSTSFWHDYEWYDLTTTPTQYIVGEALWNMKLSLQGYRNTYSLKISNGNTGENEYVTIERYSSTPISYGSSPTIAAKGTTSGTIYPGDEITIFLDLPEGYYCTLFQKSDNSGQDIDIRTAQKYTSSGQVKRYLLPRYKVDQGSVEFTYWVNKMTSLNSLYIQKVSGTAITKGGYTINECTNATTVTTGTITIPNKYYTIKLFNDEELKVSDYGGSIFSDALIDTQVIDTIGTQAFAGQSLSRIIFPSSIKTINDGAFQSCGNLNQITMPTVPTRIGARAFLNTNLSTVIPSMYNCASLGANCFAFKRPWTLTIQNKAIAQRVIATSSGSYSYSAIYGGAILGGGAIKTGGEDSLGGGGTVAYRVGNYTSSMTINANQNYYISSPVYCIQTSTSNLRIGYTSRTLNFSNYASGGIYLGTSMNNLANSSAVEDLTAGILKERYLNFGITTTCLTEHTLLTLANGSRKRADQITYKDLLLCYNFETGGQDYQYPLAITKGETHDHFTRIHLDNNLYIDICGHHDIYDPKVHLFRTYGDGHILSTGLKDYYILDDSGQTVRIRSIERVEKEVTAYCIVTGGTTTAYADTVMVGMQHMNYSRIGEYNKFTEEFETDKLLCYDYSTFIKEIYNEPEQDLILGLNLHYAHYYNKDASGLPRLLAPFKNRIPLPQYKNKNLYTLGFIDKELTEMQSVEGELIVLPEIKSPGKTKWYIVGEYKYLNPGDTYITKFSTVIRAV